MSQLPGVLLTTADRQIESFTFEGNVTRSFENSFYEAVLFHEHAVLPDIFAFISSALHKAQTSGQRFHLDAAIEAGFVVPAYRGTSISFEQSLCAIREQTIHGVRDASDFIATRLDERFANSPKKTFIQWPEDLSRNYATLVLKVLNCMFESENLYRQELVRARHWPITTEFIRRHGIIGMMEESIGACHGELRRGNLFNILLRVLNVLSPSRVEIVNDCYKELFLHPACKRDATVQEAIRNLLVVANTSYHMNMAAAFNAGNYVPGRLYAPQALPALDLVVAVSKGVGDSERKIGEASVGTSVCFDVVIPNVDQLRTAKWEDLIAIRKDLGQGYFAALKSWHKNPDEFEKCLRNYAAALTSEVKAKAPVSRVILNRFSEPERNGVVGVTKHALAVASGVPVVNGLLGLVDIGSNIAMSWMYERAVKLSFTHSPDAAIVV